MCFKNQRSMLIIVSVLMGILIYVIPRIALGAERIDDYEMKTIRGEVIDWDCKTYCQPGSLCPTNYPTDACCLQTSDTKYLGPHTACALGTLLTSCGTPILKDCSQTCQCRNVMSHGECIGCEAYDCGTPTGIYSDC